MFAQDLFDAESGRLEHIHDLATYIIPSKVMRRFSLFEAYATKPAQTLNHVNEFKRVGYPIAGIGVKPSWD